MARRLRCESGFRRRLAVRLGYGRVAEHPGDLGGLGGGKLVGGEVEPERSEDGLAVGVDVEGGACSWRVADDDECDTPVWWGGFDQPVNVVDGVGSCGDDSELPAGGAAEAELEGGRQPVPFEQSVVVAADGMQELEGACLVADPNPVEVREAVEVDADGVDVAVGEVVAGGQLDEHRAGEVLGCRGVAGDGEGAEGFEIDEHGLAVALTDGDEAREDSRLRCGGDGEVGVVEDAPGPAAVGGFPRGGRRRHR